MNLFKKKEQPEDDWRDLSYNELLRLSVDESAECMTKIRNALNEYGYYLDERTEVYIIDYIEAQREQNFEKRVKELRDESS